MSFVRGAIHPPVVTSRFRWLGASAVGLMFVLACQSEKGPADRTFGGTGGSPGGGAGSGGAAGEGGSELPPNPEGGTPGLPCNGRVEYCARPYGDVVQPTANAAMA